MTIIYLLILTNLLENALALSQAALLQHDNLVASFLQTSNEPLQCSWDGLDTQVWANDIMTGTWAPGYVNPYVDESTGRGKTPELDARDPSYANWDESFDGIVFHRGVRPNVPKDGYHCVDWFQWFQTDPCRLELNACRVTPKGNIKISRKKTEGFMGHNAGDGCKKWVWDNIFYKPRIELKKFIQITALENPSPPVDTYPTVDDVKPLNEFPNGPLYFKSKDQGKSFLAAREFCQRGGGDLISIHSKEENEAVKNELAGGQIVWLGGLNTSTSDYGPYAWTDGSPWDYEGWASNLPNKQYTGAEECAEMWPDGSWHDAICSMERLSICKFPAGGFNLAGYWGDVEDGEEKSDEPEVQDCAPGCTAKMIGDGTCHDECSNDACGYDSGDCDCSPGCSPNMLGQGSCDAECNNSDCYHDRGDCDCSPGCPVNWTGDGLCDWVCNTKECEQDGDDCTGYCAEGCQLGWIGDGVCDVVCNNADCHNDGGDCEMCAPGCQNMWLGDKLCHRICNNADCNYDNGDCDMLSPIETEQRKSEGSI